MENKLKSKFIEQILHYVFENKELLLLALTHSSYTNESKKDNTFNNERLEFLGDATLELVISEYLYKHYPQVAEGELTKMRANIVCTDSLAESALNLNIGESIIMGKGEMMSGGRTRKSIMANTLEAIIGAIYLDGGLNKAREFIMTQLKPSITKVEKGKMNRDYKTALQEMIQKNKNQLLKYKLVKEEGPDHNKLFYVEVILNSKVIGTGKGGNKKEAEQEAAKEAIERIVNE